MPVWLMKSFDYRKGDGHGPRSDLSGSRPSCGGQRRTGHGKKYFWRDSFLAGGFLSPIRRRSAAPGKFQDNSRCRRRHSAHRLLCSAYRSELAGRRPHGGRRDGRRFTIELRKAAPWNAAEQHGARPRSNSKIFFGALAAGAALPLDVSDAAIVSVVFLCGQLVVSRLSYAVGLRDRPY